MVPQQKQRKPKGVTREWLEACRRATNHQGQKDIYWKMELFSPHTRPILNGTYDQPASPLAIDATRVLTPVWSTSFEDVLLCSSDFPLNCQICLPPLLLPRRPKAFGSTGNLVAALGIRSELRQQL